MASSGLLNCKTLQHYRECLVKYDKLTSRSPPAVPHRVLTSRQLNAGHEGTSDMEYQGIGSLPETTSIAACASSSRARAAPWDGIGAEGVARMRLQNRFKTGLEIARYTAGIMRKDMAAYDADPAKYTQSLGCWHGFIAPAEADLDQEALRHDRAPLHLPVRLDGRRAALRVRPAAGPVDAREDLGAGADRRALHLPEAGRRPRARRPVPRARRRPHGRRQGQGKGAARRRSTTSRPTSCRSSPTSTPASAMRRRPTCWPRR